jgi:predicted TIM-barrel fold metal-dependent hydrolase/ubiquinone/menaquinone biosynthesis C-methylase UbiE
MMIPGKLERREFLSVAGAAVAGAAFPRLVRAQDSTKGFKKIDIHVHLGRDREEMGQITKDKAPAAVKYLIGEMDRHNVEKSMIVAVEPLFPTDVYLEAAKLEPERLVAACSVIPRPAEEAVDKLKSYRDRGAKALKLQPRQYDPRDPAAERVVAEAVRLGMPVLFHHTDTPKSFPDWLTHLANTFPNGNFVVVHFGGVYGFWDVLPLARLPNVYLETSTAFPRLVKSPMKSMLHFLAEENRLDKLIFGSELPRDYESVFAAIDELLGPGAKEDVLKAVYRGNADRILKLTVSSQLLTQEQEREKRFKVSELFRALEVKEGFRVADVGAGDGFLATRLARAVGPSGRVMAVEVAEEQVRRLRRRMQEDGVDNVEVIQGETKDPKLAAESLDGVVIVNAYHEMTEYMAMLERIHQALKPGARLAIVDPVRTEKGQPVKQPRERQVARHWLTMELVGEDLAKAGFEVLEKRDRFTEPGPGELGEQSTHMWLLIARRRPGVR